MWTPDDAPFLMALSLLGSLVGALSWNAANIAEPVEFQVQELNTVLYSLLPPPPVSHPEVISRGCGVSMLALDPITGDVHNIVDRIDGDVATFTALLPTLRRCQHVSSREETLTIDGGQIHARTDAMTRCLSRAGGDGLTDGTLRVQYAFPGASDLLLQSRDRS